MEIIKNANLKDYNSFGINTNSLYLIKVFDASELIRCINDLTEKGISYYILGSGTNVVLPDEDYNGVVVKLENKDYSINGDEVSAGAGITLNELILKLLDKGYTNLSKLYGIPGTLGGALVGNAGANGTSIYDYVLSVTVLDGGILKELKKDEIQYSYRDTQFKYSNVVVVSAVLKLEKGDVELVRGEMLKNMQTRKEKQPLEYKNAGSVFKNPEGTSAGKLIEECGLKGTHVGDAYISEKHANFIINKGSATSSDIIKLIDIIKTCVKREKGEELELEQIIVKW